MITTPLTFRGRLHLPLDQLQGLVVVALLLLRGHRHVGWLRHSNNGGCRRRLWQRGLLLPGEGVCGGKGGGGRPYGRLAVLLLLLLRESTQDLLKT